MLVFLHNTSKQRIWLATGFQTHLSGIPETISTLEFVFNAPLIYRWNVVKIDVRCIKTIVIDNCQLQIFDKTEFDCLQELEIINSVNIEFKHVTFKSLTKLFIIGSKKIIINNDNEVSNVDISFLESETIVCSMNISQMKMHHLFGFHFSHFSLFFRNHSFIVYLLENEIREKSTMWKSKFIFHIPFQLISY